MAEVVILGGYGRVGLLCAREIAQRTRASFLIAGPGIQKAESAALSLDGRASAAYGNAAEPRSLARLLEGSRVLVACCPGLSAGVLDLAIERRVAVVALSTLSLSAARRRELAERAWHAGVPVILDAGAIPGLPGVLAELLVRRFDRLAELRVASTGPWRETPAAARDLAQRPHPPRSLQLRRRFAFPAPVGPLAMRPARVADLDGFAEAHCVGRVIYLEPAGILRRLQRRGPASGFCLVAEGRRRPGADPPDSRVEIFAPDPLLPAAALAGSLCGAILAGEVPAGLQNPREARNPVALLTDLEKRGIGVRG